MKAYMWRDVHGDWLYKIGSYASVEHARASRGSVAAYIATKYPTLARETSLSAAMDQARADIPIVAELRKQLPLAA